MVGSRCQRLGYCNLSQLYRIISIQDTLTALQLRLTRGKMVPDLIVNLVPPEATKGGVSASAHEAVPVPAAAVPRFGPPSILIPTNFWSNLKQFLTERPVKVRERADAPFVKPGFGTGVFDNFKDFFSSRPVPKGPVNSRLAVSWGTNFGGFGTRIKEVFFPTK